MRNAVLVLWLVLPACGKVLALDSDGAVDADPCSTNVCECTVASQATDCTGAHQICDESGPGRVCACAPAYKEVGGACVFDGAPASTGFGDATGWTPVGEGVSIDPVAVGTVDPGAAVFTANGACGFAGFNQTFVMPPRAVADPFKITVTHRSSDPSFFDIADNTFVQVGVNGEFKDSRVVRNDQVTESFCLGRRAYGDGPVGSPVTFQIAVQPGPFSDTFFCNGTSEASISIDQVKLEVAGPGECLADELVENADFEADTAWSFVTNQGGAGSLLSGIGENASRGARLSTANRCSAVTMIGNAAFPTTLANPAVDVFFKSSSGRGAVFQIAGRNVATLSGFGVDHRRICVPRWARGTVAPIGFAIVPVSDNACTTALANTFTIDNVTFVDDPACAEAGELPDPGFELSQNASAVVPSWGLLDGVVNDLVGGRAVISNTAPNAGTRALELTGANPCVGVGEAGADFTINVPPANGAAGPAIKFFARVDNGNLNTTTRLAVEPGPRFQRPGLKLEIPEVGVYQAQTMCLPPATIGRRLTFRFSTGDTDGGGCATNYADEVAFIDDVVVTTDPTCPAP